MFGELQQSFSGKNFKMAILKRKKESLCFLQTDKKNQIQF
jgi:hypothetical protein